MIQELYDTESILENELRRKILEWYLRFDITGSIMSGNETAMGRHWFAAIGNHYSSLAAQHSENVDYKIEAAIGDHRLVCVDMAEVFAKFSSGAYHLEEFKFRCNVVAERLESWRDRLDPAFLDDRHRVWEFGGKVKEHDDIVDPYLTGGLYKGPLATFNFMIADWIAVLAMFRYKKALTVGELPSPELSNCALELCRIFEAIEHSPEFPPEAILKAQGILGVASLFLPRDERHTMWCRRKLAKIEGLGWVNSSPNQHDTPNAFLSHQLVF